MGADRMRGFPPRQLAVSERCPPAMKQRDFWRIQDFALVKEVGSGAASTVYYALCRKSCLPVAIKMYIKAKLTALNRRQVEREIQIHSSLNHPHIVDFYAAFEDEDRIYLVLEYASGGDLFDEVKRRGGRVPEAEVVQAVLHPYLCALLYLHSRGIIHRDIKPENTVFARDSVLKITDFGLAINTSEERPVTRLGTLDYMAPEVLCCPDKHTAQENKERADLAYSYSVDAWAMGVLAYELIVGRPPFGMSSRESTMKAITQQQPAMPEWVSPGAADFMAGALVKQSGQRQSVLELLQHPWIVHHQAHRASAAVPMHATGNPSGSGLEQPGTNSASSSYDSYPSIPTPAQQAVQQHHSASQHIQQPLSHQQQQQLHMQQQQQQQAQHAAAAAIAAGQREACQWTPPSKRAMQRSNSAITGAVALNTWPTEVSKVHEVAAYWRTDGDGFGISDVLASSASVSAGGTVPHDAHTNLTSANVYKRHLQGLQQMWEAGRSASSSGRSLQHNKAMSQSFSYKRRAPDAMDMEDKSAAGLSRQQPSQLESLHLQLQLELAGHQQRVAQEQQQHVMLQLQLQSHRLPAGDSTSFSTCTSAQLSPQRSPPSSFTATEQGLFTASGQDHTSTTPGPGPTTASGSHPSARVNKIQRLRLNLQASECGVEDVGPASTEPSPFASLMSGGFHLQQHLTVPSVPTPPQHQQHQQQRPDGQYPGGPLSHALSPRGLSSHGLDCLEWRDSAPDSPGSSHLSGLHICQVQQQRQLLGSGGSGSVGGSGSGAPRGGLEGALTAAQIQAALAGLMSVTGSTAGPTRLPSQGGGSARAGSSSSLSAADLHLHQQLYDSGSGLRSHPVVPSQAGASPYLSRQPSSLMSAYGSSDLAAELQHLQQQHPLLPPQQQSNSQPQYSFAVQDLLGSQWHSPGGAARGPASPSALEAPVRRSNSGLPPRGRHQRSGSGLSRSSLNGKESSFSAGNGGGSVCGANHATMLSAAIVEMLALNSPSSSNGSGLPGRTGSLGMAQPHQAGAAVSAGSGSSGGATSTASPGSRLALDMAGDSYSYTELYGAKPHPLVGGGSSSSSSAQPQARVTGSQLVFDASQLVATTPQLAVAPPPWGAALVKGGGNGDVQGLLALNLEDCTGVHQHAQQQQQQHMAACVDAPATLLQPDPAFKQYQAQQQQHQQQHKDVDVWAALSNAQQQQDDINMWSGTYPTQQQQQQGGADIWSTGNSMQQQHQQQHCQQQHCQQQQQQSPRDMSALAVGHMSRPGLSPKAASPRAAYGTRSRSSNRSSGIGSSAVSDSYMDEDLSLPLPVVASALPPVTSGTLPKGRYSAPLPTRPGAGSGGSGALPFAHTIGVPGLAHAGLVPKPSPLGLRCSRSDHSNSETDGDIADQASAPVLALELCDLP